jgi:hypothetical protein
VNADGTPATGADRLRHPLLADLVGSSGWYDVRHYEERITLWQAESADDAIALAELDAFFDTGTERTRPLTDPQD